MAGSGLCALDSISDFSDVDFWGRDEPPWISGYARIFKQVSFPKQKVLKSADF